MCFLLGCTTVGVTPTYDYIIFGDNSHVGCNSPLEAPRLTGFLQATRSSGFLHISFKLSRSLDLSPPPLYSARWCLPRFLCSHHTKPSDLPLLNDLQQRVILPKVLCNSPMYLHVRCMHLIMHLQRSSLDSTSFQMPGHLSPEAP